MKRTIWSALLVMGAAAVIAAPAFAKKPTVTCDQIQSELKAGKSAAAVAKDLHVTTKRVHNCSAASAKSK